MEAVDYFNQELKEGDYVLYASPYRGSSLIVGMINKITKKTVIIGNYRRTTHPKSEVYKILPEQVEILKLKGKI